MPEPLQAIRRRVKTIEEPLCPFACFPEESTGGVVLLRTTTRARFRVAFSSGALSMRISIWKNG